MGYGGRDYFTRQHEQRRLEWEKETAWHRGWQAGYQQGTRDMRKAYERNEVGASRQEAQGEGHQDEGVPQDVEPTICRHDGIEDASDCPGAVRITVGWTPEQYEDREWC